MNDAINDASRKAANKSHLDKALSKLAKLGDQAGVVRLLAQGADAHSFHSAPLHEAAAHGHAECVKLLIPADMPNLLESRKHAMAFGQADLAALLSSIIERAALCSTSPVGRIRPAPPSLRL